MPRVLNIFNENRIKIALGERMLHRSLSYMWIIPTNRHFYTSVALETRSVSNPSFDDGILHSAHSTKCLCIFYKLSVRFFRTLFNSLSPSDVFSREMFSQFLRRRRSFLPRVNAQCILQKGWSVRSRTVQDLWPCVLASLSTWSFPSSLRNLFLSDSMRVQKNAVTFRFPLLPSRFFRCFPALSLFLAHEFVWLYSVECRTL